MQMNKLCGRPYGRSRVMMRFNTQNRECHAERSEASLCPSSQTLRFAQGDNTVPMLVVKTHYRARGRGKASRKYSLKETI